MPAITRDRLGTLLALPILEGPNPFLRGPRFRSASSLRYPATASRVVNHSCPSLQAGSLPVRARSRRWEGLSPLYAAACLMEMRSLASGRRRPPLQSRPSVTHAAGRHKREGQRSARAFLRDRIQLAATPLQRAMVTSSSTIA